MDCIPSELLNTNRPPTELQSVQVQETIRQHDLAHFHLDGAIIDARAALANLILHQTRAGYERQRLKSILSPVRRVPPEILGELFQLSVELCREDVDYSIDNSQQSPLLLSHVSSLWQRVALDTPRLWEHLTLKHPRFSMKPRLADLVDRSHPHRLMVSLRLEDPLSLPQSNVFQDMISLPAFNERVKDLTLYTCNQVFHEFVDNPEPSFPHLSRLALDIAMKRSSSPPSLSSVMELFRLAPQLTNLHVQCTWSPSARVITEPFAPRFPWSQLADLILWVDLELHVARFLLSQCSELRNCLFSSLRCGSPIVNLVPPSHPRLKLENLTAVFLQPFASTAALYTDFNFPDLRSLHIDLFQWSEEAFIGLIERLGGNLTTLSLHNVHLESHLIVQFLEANRNIETLSLLNIVDRRIFRALTYHRGSTVTLLPQLEGIHIALSTSASLNKADGKALVAMLESRRGLNEEVDDVTELLEATLDIPLTHLSLPTRASLRKMKRAGFLEMVDGVH
ncbi:hypothetical protein C8J57DRAFT_1609915 [Mycena rebaudengoi]|nr:hypothetical protein C8J57DRAFT_1609915 [Mycena rebaudengoi]